MYIYLLSSRSGVHAPNPLSVIWWFWRCAVIMKRCRLKMSWNQKGKLYLPRTSVGIGGIIERRDRILFHTFVMCNFEQERCFSGKPVKDHIPQQFIKFIKSKSWTGGLHRAVYWNPHLATAGFLFTATCSCSDFDHSHPQYCFVENPLCPIPRWKIRPI